MKCVYGRAGVRYVITKFSGMDSLPNFLTHGAPLRARFARAGAPLKKKIAIMLPFYQNSASCQPSKAENFTPPGGGLREAVSEEDGVNSCQENILMMGQDTNVMATSQSQQLASRSTSTTLEENDITSIDGLVRNLKKVNHYIHCLLIDYLSLEFTKSVDRNFRMF